MGNVKIGNRVVIVTGPVSTGKSSFCRKMVEQYKGTCRVITIKKANPNNAASMSAVLKAKDSIGEEIRAKSFVVIQVQSMTYENLVSLISCIRIMGYKDGITLIMLNLSEELHMDFWRRNRRKYKIGLKRLKKERNEFKKIVEVDNFVDPNVTCVKVDNPEDVVFEFWDK